MGPTALLPLRRKRASEERRAEDFFALKIRRLRPGANPRTWTPKASTLPLDHRSRLTPNYSQYTPTVPTVTIYHAGSALGTTFLYQSILF